MKSGANYVVLRKLNIDVSLVDKIIFTFKGMNAAIQKEYPGEVTESNGLFAIKLYQEDTILLSGHVSLEGQINYKDGAVAKTNIDSIFIDNTLATELVEGNNPTGSISDDVTFEIVDNVIVGKIVGDVDPEIIENAVKDYLDKHPIEAYDDTEVRSLIQANANAIGTKQNVIADLDSIRSGANKGATALQSIPSDYAKKSDIPSLTDYAKKSELPVIPQNVSAFQNDSGYLTEHQDISGKANVGDSYTKTESDNKYALKGEGGGGGTTDYNALSNRPQINGETLSGNKSLADLGINNLSTSDVDSRVQTYWNSHKEELKGAKGDDYVITESDYDAIADVVLTKLPMAESEEF